MLSDSMRAIYAEALIAAADRTITLFSPTLLRPRPRDSDRQISRRTQTSLHVSLRPIVFNCLFFKYNRSFLKFNCIK